MNLFETKLKKHIISFFIISIIYCLFLVSIFYHANYKYYTIFFSILLFVNFLFLSFNIYIYKQKFRIILLLLRLYLVSITFLIYAGLFYQEIKFLDFFFSYFFIIIVVYLFFGKKTALYWTLGIVVMVLIKIGYFLYFKDSYLPLDNNIIFHSNILVWVVQIFHVIIVYLIFKTYKFLNILKLNKNNYISEQYISIANNEVREEKIALTTGTNIQIEHKQDELYKKIIQIIESKEYYLDKNFNMTMLSVELNSNINYLSKAINKYYPDGFNDLINKYRIDYFKKMVEEDKHKNYKLNYMFSKSGFKNQSTFNKAFKKIENITPSEYIVNKNSDNSIKYLE